MSATVMFAETVCALNERCVAQPPPVTSRLPIKAAARVRQQCAQARILNCLDAVHRAFGIAGLIDTRANPNEHDLVDRIGCIDQNADDP